MKVISTNALAILRKLSRRIFLGGFLIARRKKKIQFNPGLKKKVIIFVRKFGSNLRAIPAKEKKAYFLALFLDKHKYYEAEIIKLGF